MEIKIGYFIQLFPISDIIHSDYVAVSAYYAEVLVYLVQKQ